MVESFQQTDGNSVQTALCSGNSEITTSANCVMALNGTPGVAENAMVQAGLQVSPRWGFVISSATNTPYLTTWDGGDWVVRIQVATPEVNVTLEQIHICRIDAAGNSLGTVTNATSLGIPMSAGLKTHTFSSVGEVSAEVTNRIGIVLSFANSSASSENFGIIPSTNITTPLDIASVGAIVGTSA